MWKDDKGLALLLPGTSSPFRLPINRFFDRVAKRSELVRACGIKGEESALSILEPFAGFAIDSLTMAAAGGQVRAIEWHPLIYHLAQDAISRSNIQVALELGDGVNALLDVGTKYDVVYLDPMFESRGKSALPSLGAQVLRSLNQDFSVQSGSPTKAMVGIEEYLVAALDLAPRVVLKTALKQRVYGKPNHSLRGRTVKFDVYVGSAGV